MTTNFLVHFPIFRHKNDLITFTSSHSTLICCINETQLEGNVSFSKIRQNFTEKQWKFIDIILKNNSEKSLTSLGTHQSIIYLWIQWIWWETTMLKIIFNWYWYYEFQWCRVCRGCCITYFYRLKEVLSRNIFRYFEHVATH